MKPNEYVIVVGREFGSGGREVGRALAKRLGIPYYDKELLRQAAKKSGISEDIFSRADESRPSILSSILSMGYNPNDGMYTSTSMSREKLYTAQSNVVREVTHAGPCVIVGRTADYVARDLPNMVSIFLHSPLEKRVDRILARKDCASRDEATRLATRKDKQRESYYNYFTGRRWGSSSNYHLSIDASSMPTEAIVDLIISYLENRHKAAKA